MNDEVIVAESLVTLFAKVIKQDAAMFLRLNDVYIGISEHGRDKKLHYIFARH